jgi:hypothetical protein
MPTLRKIKRDVLPMHLPTQNTTFNFAQPHTKPTHHPDKSTEKTQYFEIFIQN